MANNKSDTKPKTKKKSIAGDFVRGEQMGARRTLLEELFNDLYNDRRNIYVMNFVRGIFFGLGTFLGGTIVVALVAFLLSLFVQLPFVGPTVERAKETIQDTQSN